MRTMRSGLAIWITICVAPGCKKQEPATPPESTASATPSSAGAPSPPPSGPAPSSSKETGSKRLSPAEQARHDGLFEKCQANDAAACEAVCDDFDAEICTYLSSQMLAKKMPDDPAKRAKINEKGCAKGAMKSCNQLATAYKEGDGVSPDIKKAIELYTKACDAGYGGGCNRLGNMYKKGDGVAPDGAKAAAFYEKTCSLGEGAGCNNAANAYGYGETVPQDLPKAKSLAARACALGAKDCEPPIGKGADATWPEDAKLEDVIVDPKKWDGRLIQLRGVAAYRGSPTSGYIFAPGGKPLTDGVPTLMADDAPLEVKKGWLKMPSSRDGIPVKKVTVRVEATMVPGKARFFIWEELQFYGTASDGAGLRAQP